MNSYVQFLTLYLFKREVDSIQRSAETYLLFDNEDNKGSEDGQYIFSFSLQGHKSPQTLSDTQTKSQWLFDPQSYHWLFSFYVQGLKNQKLEFVNQQIFEMKINQDFPGYYFSQTKRCQ